MGPKKVKKTKQQIEEEKALAEQQRKLEEEIERKKQEEEAEKRRVEEEKRRVEEEKRRQEELVRLNAQAPQVAERDASMLEKRAAAKRGRKKDLDDKYLGCDPLPDPDNEKDLTTFITLWKEAKDKSLPACVDNCQTAENVVKAIQLILAESMAQYDYAKIEWCNHYIEQLRAIMQTKYDKVSAEILTYIENYTKYTDEEIEALKADNTGNRKMDFSAKAEFTEKKKV
jgi:hypothetical protein